MKRLVGIVSSLAFICLIGGCGNKGAEEAVNPQAWSFTTKVDPITQAKSVVAEKQLTSEQDKNLVADFAFSCPSAGRPDRLLLTITAYDASKKVGDSIQAADVEAETIEYRLDDYGAGEVSTTGEEKFSNEIPMSVLAMVANSEKVSATMPGVIPILMMASAVDAGFSDALKEQLRAATGNFHWRGEKLVIRFRASTSVGAEDHVFTVPLDDPSVVKVAEACGWSTKPQPQPEIAPATPTAATDASTGVSAQPVAAEGERVVLKRSIGARQTPAMCNVSLGDDPEWIFDSKCAFEPHNELGGGSFVVDFHSSAEKSLLIRVDGPGRGRLFLRDGGDESRFGFITSVTRSTSDKSCWVYEGENEESGISVCVR